MYHRLRGLAASNGNQGKRSADATHMSAFGGKADILAFSIVDLAPPVRIALGGFKVQKASIHHVP
jgi:hypothetical protein